MSHLQKHIENKNIFCALFKERLIKTWLYTILPEEWRDSNEEINSERFYAALVNHRRAQRTRNFQFGTPGGIDVTDICTDDNDSGDSIVFDENAPLASSTGENIPEKKMNTREIMRAISAAKAKTIGVYAADHVPKILSPTPIYKSTNKSRYFEQARISLGCHLHRQEWIRRLFQ